MKVTKFNTSSALTNITVHLANNYNGVLSPYYRLQLCIYNIGIPISIPLGIDPNVCRIVLLCSTCDLPAKAMVMNFVQFNGFFGCSSCLQKGTHVCIIFIQRRYVWHINSLRNWILTWLTKTIVCPVARKGQTYTLGVLWSAQGKHTIWEDAVIHMFIPTMRKTHLGQLGHMTIHVNMPKLQLHPIP